MLDVPNFDALSVSELRDLRDQYRTAASDTTRALTGDEFHLGASEAMILSDYCAAKDAAIRHRLAGRISVACSLEERCERLYAKLPDHLRW